MRLRMGLALRRDQPCVVLLSSSDVVHLPVEAMDAPNVIRQARWLYPRMTVPPIRRPDFNHSLVHLTRERVERLSSPREGIARVVSAFDVLKEIISSGVIRGSGNEGFVKGTRCAVCLSEIPLSAVHYIANPPSEANERGKYRFYGIAFSKRTIFDAGGRPVIYLPDTEGTWIPADQKWRHVRYEIGSVDFTHEREWRVPGDLDLTKVPGLYILVWSPSEAKEILKVATTLEGLIRGVLPMEHVTTML
jgi:hypothetical protein